MFVYLCVFIYIYLHINREAHKYIHRCVYIYRHVFVCMREGVYGWDSV